MCFAQSVKYIYSEKNQKKSPTSTIPKQALTEFARCAYYQFNYGNGNFKAMIYYHFNNQKAIPEIEIMMESLEKNNKDAIEVLDVVWNYCRNDRDFLFTNLKSMNMTAKNAQLLTDYLIQKHTKD